jgi:hypothetical protein
MLNKHRVEELEKLSEGDATVVTGDFVTLTFKGRLTLAMNHRVTKKVAGIVVGIDESGTTVLWDDK